MNPFGDAVQQYLARQGSQVQSSLSNKESMDEAKEGFLQSKTQSDVNIAGNEFADELHEQGNKLALDMGLDMTGGVASNYLLKGAARLAMNRAASAPARANFRWKVVNARRQAELDGRNPDSSVSANEGTLRGEADDIVNNVKSGVGDLRTAAQGTLEGALGDLKTSAQEKLGSFGDKFGDFGQSVESKLGGLKSAVRGKMSGFGKAAQDLGEETQGKISGIASGVGDEGMYDPSSMGVDIPDGAGGNITKIGQMLRSMKAAPGRTSMKMGDFLNEQSQKVSGKVGDIQASAGRIAPEGADFGSESLQTAKSLGSKVFRTQNFQDAPSGSGELAIKPVAAEIAPPKITPDVPNISGEENDIESGARAFNGVDADAIDLAPELSEGLGAAGGMWSAVGSVLGDAIPFVGLGLGLFGLGESIKSAVDEAKMGDPYKAVRGEIAEAQTKMNNLSSNVSADDFESKIGAGFASSGSLAAAQFNSAKQMNVALHD